MVKLGRRVWGTLTVMVAALGGMANQDCHAGAVNIGAGYDLTQTSTAYLSYNLNPAPPPDNIVQIPFTGNPLNTFAFPGVVPTPSFVGFTDTIIHRTTGGTLTNAGDTLNTPIEVVGLSLFTNFMGMDLYATLNATPSVGTMEIVYNGIDGGTWTNDFTVYVDIFVGSLAGPLFATVTKHFEGEGNWSTTPGAYYADLIIDGVNKDGNFWLDGPAFHDDGGGSVHVVKDVTQAPEPSSALLLLSGAFIAGLHKFRRFSSKA